MNEKKKMVVIGAGFAGIQFVRQCDESLYDILLIDKINHHQFQPLFYQVATSQIEPSSISFPIRNIFRKKSNVRIRMAEVLSIDVDKQEVKTSVGDFHYDELVIAVGCKTNFFGNKELEKNTFTLKSTYDAITIRNHILQTFEAVLSSSEENKESLLNLCIVGAGPTGVELAGAFAEIKKNILPKDYPRIDFSKFRIRLIEGSKHTLNSMSDHAKKASLDYLKKMGIEVLTETMVSAYDGHILKLSTGEEIQTQTVIWSAGVIGNVISGIPEESKAIGNRIKVNRFNQVEGSENIYAIGDIAYMATSNYPKGHPQVANVAINQAKNLAKNLKRKSKNNSLKEYEYRDLGSMATIGERKAVVDLPGFKFKGFFAWLTWMFLHLMLILSIKNKLIIFINWAWAYVTKDSSLRLILTSNKKPKD
jgi:NADH dehydrogenase